MSPETQTPLSRRGVQGFGAGNQVRTGDLNLGKVALYQLSYSRSGLCILAVADHVSTI